MKMCFSNEIDPILCVGLPRTEAWREAAGSGMRRSAGGEGKDR